MERPKGNYEACRIEFGLATDLVMQSPIRFDSLLQYYCIQEDADNGIEYMEFVLDYDLPLRKLQIGQYWFWDCSNAIVVPQKQAFDTVKKKINLEGLKKNINTGRGKYCSNIHVFERKQVESVRFFAYGDYVKLGQIAQRIVGQRLGALRKNGFGLVSSAQVEKINMQYCCWDWETQVLLRDVPLGGNLKKTVWEMVQDTGLAVRYGRYRPPYYPAFADDNVALAMQNSKLNLSGRLEVVR